MGASAESLFPSSHTPIVFNGIVRALGACYTTVFSCACHQSQTLSLSGKGWHWTEENGGLNQSLLDCPSKLQATSAQSNVLTSFWLQNQDTRLTAKCKQADTWAKGAFLLPSVQCWFCNQSGSFIFNCRTKVLQRHNCSVETLLIGLISNTTTIYGAEKHSITKLYSEKLWTKYSFYKKHFFNKICNDSRNCSSYSDEETGSALTGCSSSPHLLRALTTLLFPFEKVHLAN